MICTLLNIKEVAILLGLSTHTLTRMCQNKKITYVRYKWAYAFRKDDIEKYIENHVIEEEKGFELKSKLTLLRKVSGLVDSYESSEQYGAKPDWKNNLSETELNWRGLVKK